MKKHIKNMTLSSQRANISGYELIDIVKKYNGVLIPAHCFTPHKSYYGNCTKSLKSVFKEKYDDIYAIELGLSADTQLADKISELENKTFLTNSDAHSLPKIAREYNKILVENVSYKEFIKVIKNEQGRKVLENYGMDPKLGRYHRTYCETCNKQIDTQKSKTTCNYCGGTNITKGVYDRVEEIKDKKNSKSPKNRAKYIYQIPLTFVPGVGPKIIDKLLTNFHTELNVLHKVGFDDIEAVVGTKIATAITNSIEGKINFCEGGGGNYGKISLTHK